MSINYRLITSRLELEVIHIKNIEYRINVVNKVLKYLKLDILNDEQKQIIYDIVVNINRSDLQKRRFYMVYNIGPNLKENNTYKKVASFYDCSIGAIRSSVMAVVVRLYHLPDEKFSILENILKKYEK